MTASRPEPADEGRHAPGDEPLWNESWYFDAISDDGSLGVYLRIGRLPNQGTCLYSACVTGPGRPSVMVVDSSAPLPDAADEAQVRRNPQPARRAPLPGSARALGGDGRGDRSGSR